MEGDLASVVAAARQAAGLTQAELARRAGISASYLSRIEGAAWERGGPWPTESVLRALARALGLSSTRLIAMQRAARGRQPPSPRGGHLAKRNGRLPYAVTVGHDEVVGAARELIRRNPAGGTLRAVHGVRPAYVADLLAAARTDPRLVVFLAGPGQEITPAATPNVRARVAAPSPRALDVVVGDREALFAVPDRRRGTGLLAGIVVDDPDFVAAVREWFHESVWDPAGGPSPQPPGGGGGERFVSWSAPAVGSPFPVRAH